MRSVARRRSRTAGGRPSTSSSRLWGLKASFWGSGAGVEQCGQRSVERLLPRHAGGARPLKEASMSQVDPVRPFKPEAG